ncbi:peptide synthetase [Mycobacterium saskatchewanense]|nr:condensation domain-containing protein [Mycobacterium saskatchewanense]BBX64269.1 peptide synthetase [Mycobacterium saskatchewanense]
MTKGNQMHEQAATLVRPLGATERLFYRYSQRNRSHHLIIAEFNEVLTANRLEPALHAVQRRHPLLSAHVEDRPNTRLTFCRAATISPIDLTIRRNSNAPWQASAAKELNQLFDRSRAPLMRASLLQGLAGCALLLVFDHTIADGISSVMVLRDLVAALNGETLSQLPTPHPQELQIAKALREIAPFEPSELPDDPRMGAPVSIRPFDGRLRNLHALALSDGDTAKLVERCRAERTTVHAAIVTATSRIRAAKRGEDFVRVQTPISLRPAIGIGGDCAVCLQFACTGSTPLGGEPFWDQARATAAHLATARSARGILTTSLATQQALTVDAEVVDAEQIVRHAGPSEMTVTNLGVQNLESVGPLRPTAVWGPVAQSQVDDEYVTGVITYAGRLRMVVSGHNVPDTFLPDVCGDLVSAVEDA